MIGKFIDTKKRYLEHLKDGKDNGIISDEEYDKLVKGADKKFEHLNVSDIHIKDKIKIKKEK